MCTEIASIIIINYFTCEIERGVNNNPLHTKLQLIAKWLRKVSVWFSKASSSGSHEQSECVVSDTEAQDSLECTLYHTRDQLDSDSNSAQSDSHVSSDSEESDGPTPPPPKVLNVVSRCSKSKITVMYRSGKTGECGAREYAAYAAKHTWLVPYTGGKGALCKFCKKHYSARALAGPRFRVSDPQISARSSKNRAQGVQWTPAFCGAMRGDADRALIV